MRRALARALAACCAALALIACPAAAQRSPLVAVAANMAGPAAAIAARFETQEGIRVRFSIGASGNLARQIQRGAPFELFISADTGYPRRIAEAGLALTPPRRYATGRLVLLLTAGGAAAGGGSDALRTALGDPSLARLAIASPEHAPYGRAARQVLEHLGLWQDFQGRLVIGENVGQAARFARTREVQGALLPASVSGDPVFEGAARIPVPEQWHDPLHQDMVLLRGASPAAEAFFSFMLGDAARDILAAHGYALPPRP